MLNSNLTVINDLLSVPNFTYLYFTMGKNEHGGIAYSNSIYIPQAKNKKIGFSDAYILNGVGTQVTEHTLIINRNGFIHLEMSYASTYDALGQIIQLNGVSITD